MLQVLTEREMLGGDSERGPAPVHDAQDGAASAGSDVSEQPPA